MLIVRLLFCLVACLAAPEYHRIRIEQADKPFECLSCNVNSDSFNQILCVPSNTQAYKACFGDDIVIDSVLFSKNVVEFMLNNEYNCYCNLDNDLFDVFQEILLRNKTKAIDCGNGGQNFIYRFAECSLEEDTSSTLKPNTTRILRNVKKKTPKLKILILLFIGILIAFALGKLISMNRKNLLRYYEQRYLTINIQQNQDQDVYHPQTSLPKNTQSKPPLKLTTRLKSIFKPKSKSTIFEYKNFINESTTELNDLNP